MACTTIYNYLISIKAPKLFQTSHQLQTTNQKYKNYIKNKNKCDSASTSVTPNISALAQLQELLHMTDIPYDSDTSNDHEMTDSDNNTSKLPNKCVPTIAAFKHSNNIICNACGSRGHHATKSYKRGLNFLPRDVQRRITAYNAKYGTSPANDTSTVPNKSYRALEPPDHQTSNANSPQESSQSSTSSQDQVPTISSLEHSLPATMIIHTQNHVLETNHVRFIPNGILQHFSIRSLSHQQWCQYTCNKRSSRLYYLLFDQI